MNEPIKAAIYIRVSTEDQAKPDKVSLETQREKAEAYCHLQGWEVAGIYEDAGVSGARSDRPSLAAMLQDAREGKFQRVVFWKLDRLGRKLRDLLNISYDLDEIGVGIVSVQDQFDTGTPSGRLYFSVLGAVAEFERELIRERVAMGQRGAARKGQYNTGWAPFGYDFDPETKRLVINEAEAGVVRRIFRMFIQEGLSQRAIADRLNAEGVPTKTKQTRSRDGIKKGWIKPHIERILKLPIYRGEAYYGKTVKAGNGNKVRQPKEEWIPIDCPRIVSEGEWKAGRTRARRNQRDSQRPRDKVSTFILSRLIRCQPCGYPMYGYTLHQRRYRKSYTWRYYYCSGQHRYGHKCRQPERVNADKIEGPVLEAIMRAFSDPRNVLEACQAHAQHLQAEQSQQEGRVASLRRKIENAASKRMALIDLCTSGTISEADLKRKLAEVAEGVAQAEADLEKLEEAAQQQQAVKEIEESAHAIAGQIKAHIEEMTLEERKALVRGLVERVTVDGENRIAIECVVPNLLSDTVMAPAPVTAPGSAGSRPFPSRPA